LLLANVLISSRFAQLTAVGCDGAGNAATGQASAALIYFLRARFVHLIGTIKEGGLEKFTQQRSQRCEFCYRFQFYLVLVEATQLLSDKVNSH